MTNPRRFALPLWLGLTLFTPARGADTPAELEKPAPENVRDLRAIQEGVKKTVAKALTCTVGVRMGPAAGSGVIVSKDGYVLTAGHISGKPDRKIAVILPDGRTVEAKTLGSNQGLDSGMLQITEKGDWPFAEIGDSSKLKTGQWCVALGHPDGYRPGRPAVVRVGRVLSHSGRMVRTDCVLVGGDSGGPLFDLDGKVIGIHSRIGSSLTFNIHVPSDAYRLAWDRLIAGEVWGGRDGEPYIGVVLNPDAADCRIAEVEKDSPAARAGLQADDVVLRFDRQKIDDLEDLIAVIRKHKPGDEVPLVVRRGKEVINLKVVVGKRSA